jgi:hypothetical protein
MPDRDRWKAGISHPHSLRAAHHEPCARLINATWPRLPKRSARTTRRWKSEGQRLPRSRAAARDRPYPVSSCRRASVVAGAPVRVAVGRSSGPIRLARDARGRDRRVIPRRLGEPGGRPREPRCAGRSRPPGRGAPTGRARRGRCRHRRRPPAPRRAGSGRRTVRSGRPTRGIARPASVASRSRAARGAR